MTHPLVRAVRKGLCALADPDKAKGAQAYMKTKQPFYGVLTPARRRMLRDAIAAHPIDSRTAYEGVVRELWRGRYREEMYCAMEIAEHVRTFRTDESWLLYEEMLRSATNWDTVDFIAINLFGDLLLKNRSHEKAVKRWSRDPNFWVRRASLIVHIKHKDQTNKTLLAKTIQSLMHEKEFFIRKAIGWTLRSYAYTNPKWVRDFVRANSEGLSPLSIREAMKHLHDE